MLFPPRAALFLRDFRTRFARLGQPNGNRLLAAFHRFAGSQVSRIPHAAPPLADSTLMRFGVSSAPAFTEMRETLATRMIHHASLGTNDLERARAFYDPVLATLVFG